MRSPESVESSVDQESANQTMRALTLNGIHVEVKEPTVETKGQLARCG